MEGMRGDHNATAMMHPHHKMMMMHMTFFWGKNAEILFSGWPGSSGGMYALALLFVFLLCAAVEWLSHCRMIGDSSGRVAAGMLQTALHAVRMGVAYMAMLAVMSFNAGVFLAAVAGHAVGFLLFGSRVFGKTPPEDAKQHGDLPALSC